MSTLVTGGAGYIGSHIAHLLVDRGDDVVIVDNLSTGILENAPDAAVFEHADVGNPEAIRRILGRHAIEDVVHLAGSTVVPESVERPLDFYRNNTAAARTLLSACVDAGVSTFVFSSTAAVYGEPESVPISEDAPTDPINPYGRSKLMIEQILEDAARAHPLDYVSLRYFNVAGADPEGRTGQSTPHATHLIKVACEAALKHRPKLEIFGTDYPTPDGTCIRDYIHVTDLADAHLQALDYLNDGGSSQVLNCGYGTGHSVREVVDTVQRLSGVDFPVEETSRRRGDAAEVVADPSRLKDLFGWQPQHDDLDEIVKTALAWEMTDAE
jgi:UDP-glucose 4-epimerase